MKAVVNVCECTGNAECAYVGCIGILSGYKFLCQIKEYTPMDKRDINLQIIDMILYEHILRTEMNF